MKNRVRSLLIIILIIILFLFLWVGQFDCLFKRFFGFDCPGCGMTRAVQAIFSFNILQSFSYNIMAFPLFIIGIGIIIGLLYDFIFNSDKFINFGFNFLDKYYMWILVVIGVCYMINVFII